MVLWFLVFLLWHWSLSGVVFWSNSYGLIFILPTSSGLVLLFLWFSSHGLVWFCVLTIVVVWSYPPVIWRQRRERELFCMTNRQWSILHYKHPPDSYTSVFRSKSHVLKLLWCYSWGLVLVILYSYLLALLLSYSCCLMVLWPLFHYLVLLWCCSCSFALSLVLIKL